MKQLIKQLKKCKSVAVFGHQSPDGDCIGSISAISFLLKCYNANIDIFIDDDIPERLQFLNIDNINIKEFDKNNYDTLITVDVAGERLLGKYKEDFLSFKNTIVIDHHLNRDLKGSLFTYVDSTKASCCEILYQLIEQCKIKLDCQTATRIYAGVVDDTGCFLHDNTTEYTHYVAQKLLSYGADLTTINYHLVKLKTMKSFDMNKKLDNMVEFVNDVAYIAITYKFMKDNNYSKSDIGDYVNKLVNLENCKIAFVVTEKQVGVYSVSLRCLKGYDVATIASKFNGGGHMQASGCECRGKLKVIIQDILKECQIALGENNV